MPPKARNSVANVKALLDGKTVSYLDVVVHKALSEDVFVVGGGSGNVNYMPTNML